MPPSRRRPGATEAAAAAIERFRRSWEERFDRLDEYLREDLPHRLVPGPAADDPET